LADLGVTFEEINIEEVEGPAEIVEKERKILLGVLHIKLLIISMIIITLAM
jgi:hypothetical protein